MISVMRGEEDVSSRIVRVGGKLHQQKRTVHGESQQHNKQQWNCPVWGRYRFRNQRIISTLTEQFDSQSCTWVCHAT